MSQFFNFDINPINARTAGSRDKSSDRFQSSPDTDWVSVGE